MNSNDIRFLPIEYNGQNLIIQEPYVNTIEKFLMINSLNFEHGEDRILIPIPELKENYIDTIVSTIRQDRDRLLQRGIKKNYL